MVAKEQTNRVIKLAPLLCVTFVTSASALELDTSSLWVSFDLGIAYNPVQENYQNMADDKGLSVTFNDPDTSRLSWRAGMGWDFWKARSGLWNISTHLEWIDLGNVNLDYSTSISESQLEDLYDGLADIHPNSGNGVSWGVSSHWRGMEDFYFDPFELSAELGVMAWWQDYELNGVNENRVRVDKNNGVSLYGGLRADYRIDPRLSLRLSSRLYNLEEEVVHATSLGLSYRLGDWLSGSQVEVVNAAGETVVGSSPPVLDRSNHYTVNKQSTQSLDVLANDGFEDTSALTITRISGGTAGRVTIGSNRHRIQYHHLSGSGTDDQFMYWFSDGDQEYGPVMVTIDLVDRPPTAENDRFQVSFNTSSRLDVLANDFDSQGRELSISDFSIPDYGSLSILEDVMIYTHYGDSSTTASFMYWVTNGEQEVGPVTVDLVVLPDIFTIPIMFDSASTVIRDADKPAINRLSVWMNDHPEAQISIIGHTDSSGNPDSNRELSVRRAQSVLNYLISQGIDADRLSAIGYGDTRPITDNSTPESRVRNRRVEFRLL